MVLKKTLESPFKVHFVNTVLATGIPGDSSGKAPANAGDTASDPGSGRSTGIGNGNPLQYSCLGNLTDRGDWQATVHGSTESDTLSDWAHTQTSPGRHLQCWQDPASANLLSCVPITSLQSLSGSLPVSGPFPPSSPSRLPDRAGGSQQHWAVFPRQSYPCLDYKCPTFPIQLVLSSPFCHRDKPRKVWTLSFSDDKN